MTRQIHGQYNADCHLPNNYMQPVGSGINVWLNEQVLALLGEQEGRALMIQAAHHKEKRYKWTLEELAKRGYDLRDEYHQREVQASADRRRRDKERDLELFKERLEQETIPQQRLYWENKIAKCEKYLEERQRHETH